MSEFKTMSYIYMWKNKLIVRKKLDYVDGQFNIFKILYSVIFL